MRQPTTTKTRKKTACAQAGARKPQKHGESPVSIAATATLTALSGVPDNRRRFPSMPSNHPKMPAPGLLRRLASIFYDSLLLAALWFVVSAAFLAASGGRLSSPDRPLWLLYSFRGGLLLITYLFFASFWTHGGQTLGMRAWRLKLVGPEGGPVNWTRATLRFAAALLSLAALGLGLLWVLVDREKRAWHDSLSGTQLVLLPKAR